MSGNEATTGTNVTGSALAVVPPQPSAIAKVDHTAGKSLDRLAFQPGEMGVATRAALELFKSGLLPANVKNEHAALAIIMKGRELGMPMMASFEAIYVVEGKPSLSAQAMQTLVMESGLAEYLDFDEIHPEHVTWETKRRGARKAQKVTFTIQMARDAGLAHKQVWKNYPGMMLSNRALSLLCKLVYPDVIRGMHSPEEVSDGAVIDITPTVVPPTAEAKPRGLDSVKASVAAKTAPAPTSEVIEGVVVTGPAAVMAEAATVQPTAAQTSKAPGAAAFAAKFVELVTLVGDKATAEELWKREVRSFGSKTAAEKTEAMSRAERFVSVEREKRAQKDDGQDEGPPPSEADAVERDAGSEG